MGALIVVELQGRSNLPKDRWVNTFAIAEANAIRGTGDYDDDYAAAAIGFYNTANPTSLVSIGAQFSGAISRAAGASTVRIYDITDHLDGSPHGSPRYVETFQLAGSESGVPLPEECALCVTLEAWKRSEQYVEVPDDADPDAKPTRPRQRYTGRVYLGPYQTSATAAGTNGYSRPTNSVMSSGREAIVRMATAIDDVGVGDLATLGVWSRADRAIRGIDNVRTDDSWDTQRRRGVSPTAITRLSTGELVPEIELAS